MEYQQVESVVAAILAAGSMPGDSTDAKHVIEWYREILREIRNSGQGFAQADIVGKKIVP